MKQQMRNFSPRESFVHGDGFVFFDDPTPWRRCPRSPRADRASPPRARSVLLAKSRWRCRTLARRQPRRAQLKPRAASLLLLGLRVRVVITHDGLDLQSPRASSLLERALPRVAFHETLFARLFASGSAVASGSRTTSVPSNTSRAVFTIITRSLRLNSSYRSNADRHRSFQNVARESSAGTILPHARPTPPAQTPRTGSICLARPRIRYRVQISAPRARARCAETPRASRPTPVRLKSVQRRAFDYAAPIDRARRPRARIDERCVQTSTSNTRSRRRHSRAHLRVRADEE